MTPPRVRNLFHDLPDRVTGHAARLGVRGEIFRVTLDQIFAIGGKTGVRLCA